jgi:hypothetical protein
MASTVAPIAPTNDFTGSVNVTSTSNIFDKEEGEKEDDDEEEGDEKGGDE